MHPAVFVALHPQDLVHDLRAQVSHIQYIIFLFDIYIEAIWYASGPGP